MSEVTANEGLRPSENAVLERQRGEDSSHLKHLFGTTGLLAVGFLVIAIGAFALPAHRSFSLIGLLTGLVAYAIASRVEIEFPGFAALPTEAVFVVMWFTLPARALPLVVCGAMVLGRLPDVVRGRMAWDRLLLVVANSWHAVGPALVLYLAGSRGPRWTDVPIYCAALAAQFALDFASIYALNRTATGFSAVEHLKNAVPAWRVDTALAPLGLLAAFPATRHPAIVLLLLPLLLIVRQASVEREQRNTIRMHLNDAYEDTSYLVGDLIEADDEYTGSHSRELVGFVLGVSAVLGLDEHDRQLAELTAILHDVGKVRIPKEIINKPGPLDDEERALMNTHTILGEQLLERRRGLLGQVGPIVRSCHERWDGAGYPDGLAGEDIPLIARIVCCCDAWSAMTSDRPYRSALGREEAAAELRRSSGSHFDPAVVDALIRVLAL